MTLSASLASAQSGLNAASRGAGVISANIANALTEGYARREIRLGAQHYGTVGQGVQVEGISRQVDALLLRDLRLAHAMAEGQDLRAAFHGRLDDVMAGPGNLAGRIDGFDAALIAAAALPDSDTRLADLLVQAGSVIDGFRSSAAAIQSARMDADAAIAVDVARLNNALDGIARLNADIAAMGAGRRDSSALQDQRQILIDQVAAIVPLRSLPDAQGRVALYSTGGAVLLDMQPRELGFTPAGVITADMTLASGALSGLTLDGQPLRSDDGGPLAGGRLAANLAIRDVLAPGAQDLLDAMARDLVERFQDPALDPTRAPGGPGLFTDQGAAFDPADMVGLSQRLRLAPAADPAQGGALWRLRDGLGATTPGPTAQGILLQELRTALNAARIATGPLPPAGRSLSDLANATITTLSAQRLQAETSAGFAMARAATLEQMHLAQGVDSDRELQDLLLIEQAFGANARVISTVDDMIQTLLGL
ncbi:flagellar hook-associated protein FlgK [Szabonella alba]|uniref:Flagellar hook-associated protein 1 n=1 Tax=Szabonella alba TaxID=2804194 RepID=A0A8K0VB89_9RHOB|nr:flagellar hook-associated protein FlgK [Szabonella alba]